MKNNLREPLYETLNSQCRKSDWSYHIHHKSITRFFNRTFNKLLASLHRPRLILRFWTNLQWPQNLKYLTFVRFEFATCWKLNSLVDFSSPLGWTLGSYVNCIHCTKSEIYQESSDHWKVVLENLVSETLIQSSFRCHILWRTIWGQALFLNYRRVETLFSSKSGIGLYQPIFELKQIHISRVWIWIKPRLYCKEFKSPGPIHRRWFEQRVDTPLGSIFSIHHLCFVKTCRLASN